MPPQLAVAGLSCLDCVSNETMTNTRKPSGIVTIAGWLKGTIAEDAASAAVIPNTFSSSSCGMPQPVSWMERAT